MKSVCSSPLRRSYRRSWQSALPDKISWSDTCTDVTLSFASSIVYQSAPATNSHIRLMALFLGLLGWAGTRKVKPIWIVLKQETVSGSGISWAICKSALRSRQITTPAPHHSVFYRPDALPAAQPTVSMHWRPILSLTCKFSLKLDWTD